MVKLHSLDVERSLLCNFLMQHLCACFGECDFVRVLKVLGKNLVFSPAFVCMNDDHDDVTSDNVEQRSSILHNICVYVFYMRLYQFRSYDWMVM
jgi:hypothetical protein